MNIEFKPHIEVNADGSRSHSDVFPFVNGKPAPSIANCVYCRLYRENSDWCAGWVNDKENAPLFCGPICTKFTPTGEAYDRISAMEVEP